MKVYVLLLSSVSFANYLITVNSETFSCKLVPFETKEGISGNCCVFFKNSSGDGAFPNEDVTQQILDRKNRTYPSSSIKENDGKMEQLRQNGNKVSCKMIPFETKEGTSGSCCVIFKNVTQDFAILKERVPPPIAENKTEENNKTESTQPKPTTETKENNTDKLQFPERGYKERVTPSIAENKTDENKNKTESTLTRPTPEVKDNNSDKFLFPERRYKDEKQKEQNQTENVENITIKTKNAFDTPEKCLPPKMRDHTGSCTEPF